MRSGYGAEGRLSSAKVVRREDDGMVLVQLLLPVRGARREGKGGEAGA